MQKNLIIGLTLLLSFPPAWADESRGLASQLLEFSKTHNSHFNPGAESELQEWEHELHTRTGDIKNFRSLIRVWEQFIYSEKNLKLGGESFFIDEVIRREKASRLGITGLWTALAGELHIPFFMILAPRHPFLVYDSAGVRKYLDTGTPRRSYELDYFKRSAGMQSAKKMKKNFSAAYFRILSSTEVIALYRHALALEYARAGKTGEAVKLIEQAKKDFPEVAEFSSDLGQIFLESGNVDAAGWEFEEAVKNYPKDLTALGGLAHLAWKAGNLTRAKDLLGRIVEVDSENLDALHDLALLELIRSGLREADTYADSILHFKPEDPEALAYHATIQYVVGQRSAAKENFETSLKKGSDDPRTLMAFGLRHFLFGVYVDDGFLWQAMEYFRRAEAKDPSNWVTQYFIGLVYFHGLEFARAKETFEQVLELAPESSDAMLHQANTLIELGEFYAAKNYIEQAETLEPDAPFLHYTKAVYFFRTGKIKPSIRQMKKAVKQAPYIEKNYWQLFLAEIYLENHNPDKALSVINGILEEDSRYFKAYALRGAVYLEKKDYANAKTDLMLALNYLSKNEKVLLSLAKLSFQQKDYFAAWKYVRGAQAKGLQDPEFMAKLRAVSKEPPS
ncbi:MAG: tetratricopeptide repeat protein [Candidatus Omnitrophica bacterium]|nr:tetratricopeptide repeat protein [Candidatus Omnitrophota bacterium]